MTPSSHPGTRRCTRNAAVTVAATLTRVTNELDDAPHWVLTLSCPDRPGIVHAVAGAIAATGGNITESQQFGDPQTGLFFMRVQVQARATEDTLRRALEPVAREFEMTWQVDSAGRPMRTLVMASTTEHCLGDLLFRQRSQRLPIDIRAVVSNHTVLAPIADFYGVDFHHVPVTKATKAQAEARLLQLVADLDVELVVLARYMQILSDEVCAALEGRVINIHHSFLPSFKGARPYAQAHDRGVKLIGATAHYAKIGRASCRERGHVTGVQTCALPISPAAAGGRSRRGAGGAGPVHADPLRRGLRGPGRPGDQHPPFVPAQFQGRTPVRAGARPGREADRRDGALRDCLAGRGADHRAGRAAGAPFRRRVRTGGDGPGRRAPGTGPRGALARRAPGAAQRAPHRHLRLSAPRSFPGPRPLPPFPIAPLPTRGLLPRAKRYPRKAASPARVSSRFWGEYAWQDMRPRPKTSNSPGNAVTDRRSN